MPVQCFATGSPAMIEVTPSHMGRRAEAAEGGAGASRRRQRQRPRWAGVVAGLGVSVLALLCVQEGGESSAGTATRVSAFAPVAPLCTGKGNTNGRCRRRRRLITSGVGGGDTRGRPWQFQPQQQRYNRLAAQRRGGKGEEEEEEEENEEQAAAPRAQVGEASAWGRGVNRRSMLQQSVSGAFVASVVPFMPWPASPRPLPSGLWGASPALAAVLDRTRLGTPILTESVLLDLLPLTGDSATVLRDIQREIERATILRTLVRKAQVAEKEGRTPDLSEAGTLNVPASVWDKVASVAVAAKEILDTNRAALSPAFREVDSAETQIRRAERGEGRVIDLRQKLLQLAAAARERRIGATLVAQEDALRLLADIGELMVVDFPFKVTTNPAYKTIPRLLGRAKVDIVFRSDPLAAALPPPSGVSAIAVPPGSPSTKNVTAGGVIGNVTLLIDGFSAPVTAGNFLDLCSRGFYNDLPLRRNQSDENTNGTVPIMVAGSYKDGFVDPVTGSLRRLPLEILRTDPNTGNKPMYGAARNTRVFTRQSPVQSFRIPGAMGMNHPTNDGNGGSSEFFWLPDDNLDPSGHFMRRPVEYLDGRYSIFAYVVRGESVLARLKEGDVIKETVVTYGLDNLVKAKAANFIDLFMDSDEDD